MSTLATHKFRAGLVQMCTGRDVERNLRDAGTQIREAVAQGAQYVQTPEITSLMEMERARLFASVHAEHGNRAVNFFAELALELKIWLHIGSLPILLDKQQDCQSLLPVRAERRCRRSLRQNTHVRRGAAQR